MKQLLIFLAILILAAPAWSAVVTGGTLGYHLDGISDPGAALVMGAQEEIADNDYIRLLWNKANYGDSTSVSSVGAVNIRYFLVKNDFFFGHRISIDYEVDDANLGFATGIEGMYRGIVNDINIYLNIDFVNRRELGTYVQIGAGLILFD